MFRQKPSAYFIIVLSFLAYLFVAYGVQRYETASLLVAYGFLFCCYTWIFLKANEEETQYWVKASIAFRLIFLFALPSLSDDFYRFIWDGRLIYNGYHPFAHLPSYYLENHIVIPGITGELYAHLNSPEYFTVYPPLAQFVFWLSVIFSPASIMGSVVVMRVAILISEAGTLLLLKTMLSRFSLNKKSILIYALNPLVIIELTGNLHFEAFVITFVLLALLLLTNKKIIQAGVAFAFSIGAKLLPVIFLPLFLIRVGLKRAFLFYAVVGITCVCLFLPMFNQEIINGFGNSLSLYFKRFEFNASIYYLVREYGYLTKGYNIIQTVGWKLGVASAVAILLISFWYMEAKRVTGRIQLQVKKFQYPDSLQSAPEVMMWVLLIYLLFTTTLHPWYITTLLMLSVFTSYRFVIVWTGIIFITYTGYSVDGYTENLWFTLLEYVLVIGYLVYELIWKGNKFSWV